MVIVSRSSIGNPRFARNRAIAFGAPGLLLLLSGIVVVVSKLSLWLDLLEIFADKLFNTFCWLSRDRGKSFQARHQLNSCSVNH